ncbi:MAG TPA: cytochrome b N-terminal domain-containing protein [Nitrolancea sp.]|nr:cytochrome b N-terminal domain-containing protein [Nitrolancea sp.]
MKRAWHWIDQRLGWTKYIRKVVEHPVPPNVNWWYVFGSATLVAFIVQIVTGVALAFTYVPAPNSAFDSLQFITHHAILGSVVRGIHYWGASAMVILITIHMIRVFMMGSYKYPREMNWLVGVGLFFLTLGMAFTGQLLRWDQDAYWAIVVGAEQAGRVPVVGGFLAHTLVAGNTVGGATLTRFYATHVFLLPALMFLLIGTHLYLVVVHGISEPPEPGHLVDPETYVEEYEELIEKKGIPFWPDAAWRDVVVAVAIGTIVLGLAIFVGPKELAQPADPTILKVYPRPDWYFLWYFALLALLPRWSESWFIVGAPVLGIIALIAVPFISNRGERSPSRRPWAIAIVAISILAVAVLVREGEIASWSPKLSPSPLPATVTQPLQGSALAGSAVFQNSGCLSCHTIAGDGGDRGPDLTHIGSNLTASQLTTRILNGGHNMPAFGTILNPDEVTQLVDFLTQMK